MRALVVTEPGEFTNLKLETDHPDPTPGPGEVTLRVKCAGLNHLDLFVMRGLPGLQYPHIGGADGVGKIEAVGDGVTNVKPGDRVIVNPGIAPEEDEWTKRGEDSLSHKFGILGEHWDGTFAELVKVPAENAHVAPVHLRYEGEAAFPLTFLTAYRMLFSKARVQKDETVLIWGIGGGVSLASLLLCKALGCTLIVTSGDDEKLQKAKGLGADHTLNHHNQDVAREVRGITGKRGVDIVVDSVGEATWEASIKSLAKGGRLVTCGATTGPRGTTDLTRIFWNQLTIYGSTMGNKQEFRDMLAFVDEHKIQPIVDTVWPMTRYEEAYKRLDSGEQFGKVLMLPEE